MMLGGPSVTSPLVRAVNWPLIALSGKPAGQKSDSDSQSANFL